MLHVGFESIMAVESQKYNIHIFYRKNLMHMFTFSVPKLCPETDIVGTRLVTQNHMCICCIRYLILTEENWSLGFLLFSPIFSIKNFPKNLKMFGSIFPPFLTQKPIQSNAERQNANSHRGTDSGPKMAPWQRPRAGNTGRDPPRVWRRTSGPRPGSFGSFLSVFWRFKKKTRSLETLQNKASLCPM